MTNDHEQFALESPISIITGKERQDLTREDLIKVIVQKQIQRITFHYTAIDGKIKELKIPISSRKHAELVLTEGERVDGSSLFKGIVDTGSSDLYVVPEYKTAFLNPFDEYSLDFICRFFDHEGKLAFYTPDNILRRASQLLKDKTGLELHALGELEFFLLNEQTNVLYPPEKQRGYHASAPYVKNSEILNEMLKHISQITGNVKYAHHEVGCIDHIESSYAEINGKSAEQVEIEFLLTPIEQTADIMTLSRWIIRNTAYKHGIVATFVPKLEIGHAGSGMHFHMALMKDGKNIMNDAAGELTKESKMLIGGLCRYAPSLTSFGNMVAASYLRLVPGQEAPTKVCWSARNRSALIRVPLGWSNVDNLAQKINPQQKDKLNGKECRQTVELRSPDGSGFSHFLLAGMTLAAEWGLTNEQKSLEIAEQSHVSANIHASDTYSNLNEIATCCVESAEKLIHHRKDYERDNIFPSKVIEHVAEVLTAEDDRDMNKKLMAMPEKERQIESRRIMHRGIHKH